MVTSRVYLGKTKNDVFSEEGFVLRTDKLFSGKIWQVLGCLRAAEIHL